MTDKEQIIINGVNVSGCKCYNKNIKTDCLLYPLQPDACKNNPNCYFKQLARKTQECEELKIKLIQKDEVNTFFNTPIEGWDNDPCKICESKNNYEQLKEDYAELEQECEKYEKRAVCFKDVNKQLGYKYLTIKQECENLKAEEKYLKQCCEKAGEELAKHSFEYDGKEKNLVVQAMELNEKYEKLEKTLEEIEKYCGQNRHAGWVDIEGILDIINKVKGEEK